MEMELIIGDANVVSDMMMSISSKTDVDDDEIIRDIMLSKTYLDCVEHTNNLNPNQIEHVQSRIETELNVGGDVVNQRPASSEYKFFLTELYRRCKGMSCEETLRDFQDSDIFGYIERNYEDIRQEFFENFVADVSMMIKKDRACLS